MNILKIIELLKNKFQKNEKILNKFQKTLTKINDIEKEIENLSDEQLKEVINNFKKNENKNIEMSFALTREVSKRVINIRHYDVQIIGGLVLANNAIAEMKTGEGKTFVATLAAIYKSLNNKKVHIVTVNDYLAKRDKELLEPIYNFFGLTVSLNEFSANADIKKKKEIYSADIIYGTNSEFCFDYMRNNLAKTKNEKIYKNNELQFVIIDEVDSVLIDEAKQPLILSENIETNILDLTWANEIVLNHLKRSKYDETIYTNKLEEINQTINNPEQLFEPDGDYFYEEGKQTINIFESGYEKIEQYALDNNIITNREDFYNDSKYMLLITNAIKAHCEYIKDRDYIVNNEGEIVIIDLFTGRLKINSKWSNLIHQAIELKEGVKVSDENKIIARITYQNYFNLYDEKSGMTGTASTEAPELYAIYNLNTVIIPPNKPIIRIDLEDKMYVRSNAKYNAILEDIKTQHKLGQPILIGTPLLYISEKIAKLLEENNIPFNILNAKNHEKESKIISNAGKLNAITISTNMAGRGTDIILGGNIDDIINNINNNKTLNEEEKENEIKNKLNLWRQERDKVIELGGLYVIGIDKNEARRIDNQLKGRSGRQGEIGKTLFYISLEDELVVNNTKPEILNHIMKFFDKIEDYKNNNIESTFNSWNKTVSKAQERVEEYNCGMRKQLLKYDTVIYEKYRFLNSFREEVLYSDNEFIDNKVLEYMGNYIENKMTNKHNINEQTIDDYVQNIKEVLLEINNNTEEEIKDVAIQKIKTIDGEYNNIQDIILKASTILFDIYNLRWKQIEVIEDQNTKYEFERVTLLEVIDELWVGYLDEDALLKVNSNLSYYGGKNSLTEYKINTHKLFLDLLKNLKIFFIDKIINENMSLNSIDIKKIKMLDISNNSDIENMNNEELEEELKKITKELSAIEN